MVCLPCTSSEFSDGFTQKVEKSIGEFSSQVPSVPVAEPLIQDFSQELESDDSVCQQQECLSTLENDELQMVDGNGNSGDVIICSLNSKSMYTIPISIQGHETRATVDTAAEVIKLSDELYQCLPDKPPIINTVSLQTAGRQHQMKALVVGPVTLRLGSTELETWRRYVIGVGFFEIQ